jgi:hypothetical protein
MEMSQGTPSIAISNKQKCLFSKIENKKRTGVWGLTPVGGGKM